jgi:hypothetical protein
VRDTRLAGIAGATGIAEFSIAVRGRPIDGKMEL